MTRVMPSEQNEKNQHPGSGPNRREILLTGISIPAAFMMLGRSNSAMAIGLATPIYAIRQNGDMLFYKHAGYQDGSPDWPIQARKIGTGWNFRQVFAGRSA